MPATICYFFVNAIKIIRKNFSNLVTIRNFANRIIDIVINPVFHNKKLLNFTQLIAKVTWRPVLRRFL